MWPKVAALKASIEQRVQSQEAARKAVAFARSASTSAAVARLGARSAPASVRAVLFQGGAGAEDGRDRAISDADADAVAVLAVEEGEVAANGEMPAVSSRQLPAQGAAGAAHMQRLRSQKSVVTSASIRLQSARRVADVSSARTFGTAATAVLANVGGGAGTPEEQLRDHRARGVMRAIAITAVAAQAMRVAQLLQESVTGEDEAAAALLGVTAASVPPSSSGKSPSASTAAAALRLGLPRATVQSLLAATSSSSTQPPGSKSASSVGDHHDAAGQASNRAAAEAARLGLALCAISAGADAAARSEAKALSGGLFGCCGAKSPHAGVSSPAAGRVRAVRANNPSADGPDVQLPLTVNPLASKRTGRSHPSAGNGSASAAASTLPVWAAALPGVRSQVAAVIASASGAGGATLGMQTAAASGISGAVRRASFDQQSWAPAVPRSLMAAKQAREKQAKPKPVSPSLSTSPGRGSMVGAASSAKRPSRVRSRGSALALGLGEKPGPSDLHLSDVEAGLQLTPLRTGSPAAAKMRMAHVPVTVASTSNSTSHNARFDSSTGSSATSARGYDYDRPTGLTRGSSNLSTLVVPMPAADALEPASGQDSRQGVRTARASQVRTADIRPGLARRTVSSSGRAV